MLLDTFYSIGKKFFTKTLLKIEAKPEIICYAIGSIPLVVFVFIYFWYGPDFGGPTPPAPSASSLPISGLSVGYVSYIVTRVCQRVNYWGELRKEMQDSLEHIFQPLLSVIDPYHTEEIYKTAIENQERIKANNLLVPIACFRRVSGIHLNHERWDLLEEVQDACRKVENSLKLPSVPFNKLQLLALNFIEWDLLFLDLYFGPPVEELEEEEVESILTRRTCAEISEDFQKEFYAEFHRLEESSAETGNLIEKKDKNPQLGLGSIHKKLFSPVVVNTAIALLMFCLTKVAVAIVV